MSARLLPAAVLVWGALASAQAVPVDRTELGGAIAGRVCRDLDGDGACAPNEPGAAGVRVVLETGQEALTDAEGRYSVTAPGARDVDPLAGRWFGGRHRLRVDARGFPPGAEVTPRAATVEVPLAGLALQNFALRLPGAERPKATVSHSVQPPAAKLEGPGRFRFLAAGSVTPGSEVMVAGERAEVGADGIYRAWVPLGEGANELAVSVRAPSGVVSLFRQRVEVIVREGGALIVPRPLEPSATVQLPSTQAEEAAAGRSSVRVEGPAGTRVGHAGGEAVIPESGAVEVPVDLKPGENQVALSIATPGSAPTSSALSIRAQPRPLLLGLLDLELSLSPSTGALRLHGRGAGHGELQLGEWTAKAQVDLRDSDRESFRGGGATALLLARRPEALERVLDPDRFAATLGDDSTVLSPNSPEGRLRLELRHERYGALGLGTFAATEQRGEVGRYRRTLFGPNLELRAPFSETAGASLKAFFASGAVDPARPLSTAPARARFFATGGSVYYLGHSTIAQGSEVVRVELLDGVSELPLAEHHLVRGRDYELDYHSGRILLARPLSFFHSSGLLGSDPLSGGVVRALVVDYERLILGASRDAYGAQARANLGPLELGASAIGEAQPGERYQLLGADVAIPLGPLTLLAEAAATEGRAQATDGFLLSDDGGLSTQAGAASPSGGSAVAVRLRGKALTEKGVVDLSFRTRSAGFSDAAHLEAGRFRQVAARLQERFGGVLLGVHADDRLSADPRLPLDPTRISARNLGGFLGYEADGWGVRLEARDSALTAADDPFADPAQLSGGRTGVGAAAFVKVGEGLRLVAAHRQVLARRGEGLGAIDDTFTSAGVDLALGKKTGLSVRGGYGPVLGPQAWLSGFSEHGEDTWYGSYSVDVDGPDFGTARAVAGARTELGGKTFAFVEDVSSHDARTVRASRAVGLTHEVGGGLTVSAHYERGGGAPLLVRAPFLRDAGGATASWSTERVRLFARGEYRADRGRSLLSAISRRVTQRVLSAGAEVALVSNLRASARANFTDSWEDGVREARLLEGGAVLAWRTDPISVVARYGVLREALPPGRGAFAERFLHTASLMPALSAGRFALSSGLHAAVSGDTVVLAASLRPSLRVWEGLEVAAEAARRSAGPPDEALSSLRGELGYRFQQGLMLALGYTFHGYTGTGLPDGSATQDRLYVRAELAY